MLDQVTASNCLPRTMATSTKAHSIGMITYTIVDQQVHATREIQLLRMEIPPPMSEATSPTVKVVNVGKNPMLARTARFSQLYGFHLILMCNKAETTITL